MRRPVLLVLLALTTGIFGYLVALRFTTPELRVDIVNRSGAAVSDVRLHFTGGTRDVGALASGARWSDEIRPTGESPLEVSWVETLAGAEPTPRRERLDVYLEPGTAGRYELELQEGGIVTFRGESTLRMEGQP